MHSDDDKKEITYKKLLQSQMTWLSSTYGQSHGIRVKRGKKQKEEAEINIKCKTKERTEWMKIEGKQVACIIKI